MLKDQTNNNSIYPWFANWKINWKHLQKKNLVRKRTVLKLSRKDKKEAKPFHRETQIWSRNVFKDISKNENSDIKSFFILCVIRKSKIYYFLCIFHFTTPKGFWNNIFQFSFKKEFFFLCQDERFLL